MYINWAKTKKQILQKMHDERPECEFTRVSPKVKVWLELKIDEMLDRAVHAHPSSGKTFREIM